MPVLRGHLSGAQRKVGHFADNAQVLEFVGGQRFEELADLGTSCPDHFLRTKIRPLVLPADPGRRKSDRGRNDRSLPDAITRPTTNDAAGPTLRRCAMRTRW